MTPIVVLLIRNIFITSYNTYVQVCVNNNSIWRNALNAGCFCDTGVTEAIIKEVSTACVITVISVGSEYNQRLINWVCDLLGSIVAPIRMTDELVARS